MEWYLQQQEAITPLFFLTETTTTANQPVSVAMSLPDSAYTGTAATSLPSSASMTEPETRSSEANTTGPANPKHKRDLSLPWIISGVAGALLLSIIVTNILICATVFKKRQVKTASPPSGEVETGSRCDSRQSSTYPIYEQSSTYGQNFMYGQNQTYVYDYIAPEDMEYVTNPVYGEGVGQETQFNIDNNPSYRTSIKASAISRDKDFNIEKNPSYRTRESSGKVISSNFHLEKNPSYKIIPS